MVSAALAAWILASVLVHRLPHKASDRSDAPLLAGAEIAASATDVFNHACIDCHSEKTRWPWYSNLAPASWFIEGDVKRARTFMNLSRWDSLDTTEQRTLLTAIATVIENHEMPPHRYVMVHPEAKLSADDSVQVIEWTRAERRRLRASVAALETK
jgi:Haem-binding domain